MLALLRITYYTTGAERERCFTPFPRQLPSGSAFSLLFYDRRRAAACFAKQNAATYAHPPPFVCSRAAPVDKNAMRTPIRCANPSRCAYHRALRVPPTAGLS